jgi:hypothetical protein
MPVTTDLIRIVNEKADVLIKLAEPYVANKTVGIVTLSAAVALALIYTTIQKFNRPPSKLRHLPYVGFLSFLNYTFRDQLFEKYSEDLIMPLMKQSNGIYMVITILTASKKIKILITHQT